MPAHSRGASRLPAVAEGLCGSPSKVEERTLPVSQSVPSGAVLLAVPLFIASSTAPASASRRGLCG